MHSTAYVFRRARGMSLADVLDLHETRRATLPAEPRRPSPIPNDISTETTA